MVNFNFHAQDEIGLGVNLKQYIMRISLQCLPRFTGKEV